MNMTAMNRRLGQMLMAVALAMGGPSNLVAQTIVLPDGEPSGDLIAGTSGHVAYFDVTASTWSVFTCESTAGITCDVQAEGYPGSIPVSFDTTGETGLHSLFLTVQTWDPPGCEIGGMSPCDFSWDSGWREFNILPPIDVTPASVPASVTQYSQSQSATYTVTNQSGSPKTVTVTCSWDGVEGSNGGCVLTPTNCA
jgi:hypothetical protein